MTVSATKRRVLIIVENLPCPFDRRVWQEALALHSNGYQVSIICPKGRGYEKRFEVMEGIHIYRHALPIEAKSAIGYALEYGIALSMEFWLSLKVAFTRGFDVIHACNPPDTIFLLGRFYRIFGKRFIFDHHDINPELYEAKFERRDIWYRLMCLLERWTFAAADISIATNESYRNIAIERGGMSPDSVFVVRSGPDLKRIKRVPPNIALRRGRSFLVAYVGVIGSQEGLDLLLKAVCLMRDELGRTDAHFVIMGDGTELDYLRDLSRELKVDGLVEFTGRVSEAQLWETLGSSDVCVNPDRVNDMNDKSTMNKILEYMALGKPIVQFQLTEGRVSAGAASEYAAPNDPLDFAKKLCDLLDDPSRREEMGRIGKLRVEGELAWRHQVPRLLAAYEKAFS
jgi:glycosyltransferase involved in cell wall biosynthesis